MGRLGQILDVRSKNVFEFCGNRFNSFWLWFTFFLNGSFKLKMYFGDEQESTKKTFGDNILLCALLKLDSRLLETQPEIKTGTSN